MSDITKISKDSVSELVYQQLKENVVEGKWLPGDRIPSENQLVSLFGVSRVSVRVAIQKMITLGLLEARVGEGTYVKEFTLGECITELAPMIMRPKNQIEVLEFRKALETEVIRLAVRRASETEIQNLENTYSKMCSSCNTSNLEEYFNLDGQFHDCLFSMTKNSMFISISHFMNHILLEHYQSTVRKSWDTDGIPQAPEEDEHYNILMGLKNRDADLALKAYTDMIDAKIAMFSKMEEEASTIR